MKIKQRGFTLIELLVVMFLFSLLMLGTISIMSTVSTAQASVERKLEMTENIRVASIFLRSVLGRISVNKNYTKDSSDQVHERFFRGEKYFLEWLGFMPARYGLGGTTYFRLFLEDGHLILSALNWSGESKEIDWSQAHQSVLADSVRNFSIEYQDNKKSTKEWKTDWSETKDIPSAIKINVQTSAGNWPLLVVKVHGNELSVSRAVVGGS